MSTAHGWRWAVMAGPGLLAFLWTSSCVLLETKAPGPSADRFCEKWADAICDWQSRCGCQTLECRERAMDECSGPGGFLSSEVLLAIEGGIIRYDRAMAANLLEQQRTASCATSSVERFGWTWRDVYDMGGVLEGTLSPGSPCTLRSDYAFGGSGCRTGLCIDGQCVGVVDFGDRCGDQEYICRSLDYELRLDPDPGLAQTYGSCTDDGCGPPLGAGAPCSDEFQCESRLCVGGTCQARLPDGSTCEYSSSCSSGLCSDNRCYGEGTGALGTPCSHYSQCQSLACEDGECVSPACRGY